MFLLNVMFSAHPDEMGHKAYVGVSYSYFSEIFDIIALKIDGSGHPNFGIILFIRIQTCSRYQNQNLFYLVNLLRWYKRLYTLQQSCCTWYWYWYLSCT